MVLINHVKEINCHVHVVETIEDEDDDYTSASFLA